MPRSTAPTRSDHRPGEVRERILACASSLFYEQGVRAVGVDLVVERSGVAKTSLYRYFPSKDDLVVAFLEREDVEFWSQWDSVAARHREDAAAELAAQLHWIAERLARSRYRGCPQINVAAEFAAAEHPARQVARAHMQALRTRLENLARRLGVAHPDALALQLAVLVNGAFVSSELLAGQPAQALLQQGAMALVAAAR